MIVPGARAVATLGIVMPHYVHALSTDREEPIFALTYRCYFRTLTHREAFWLVKTPKTNSPTEQVTHWSTLSAQLTPCSAAVALQQRVGAFRWHVPA